MRKLSDWLNRVSGIWVVLFFSLLLILFAVFILPTHAVIGTAEEGAPKIPDLFLWYTPGYLYDIADAYGETGRMEFLKMHAGFDVIWPLVYVGFLAVSLSWTTGLILKTEGRISRFSGILPRLNLIPILAGISDFLENIFTSVVILRFPERSPVIDALSPVMTLLKWILVFSSVLILSATPGILISRLISGRKKKKQAG
jgi:hypothetical protein